MKLLLVLYSVINRAAYSEEHRDRPTAWSRNTFSETSLDADILYASDGFNTRHPTLHYQTPMSEGVLHRFSFEICPCQLFEVDAIDGRKKPFTI